MGIGTAQAMNFFMKDFFGKWFFTEEILNGILYFLCSDFTFNGQCSHYIKTSQLICSTSWLFGFYNIGTFVANVLKMKKVSRISKFLKIFSPSSFEIVFSPEQLIKVKSFKKMSAENMLGFGEMVGDGLDLVQ